MRWSRKTRNDLIVTAIAFAFVFVVFLLQGARSQVRFKSAVMVVVRASSSYCGRVYEALASLHELLADVMVSPGHDIAPGISA